MKGARFESKEAVWAAADKDQVLFVRRRSLSLTRRASLHSLTPSLPPSEPPVQQGQEQQQQAHRLLLRLQQGSHPGSGALCRRLLVLLRRRAAGCLLGGDSVWWRPHVHRRRQQHGQRKKGKTSIGSTRRVVQGLDLCSNVRTGRVGKLMADAAAAQGFAVPSDAVLGHTRKQTKAEALDSELDEAYTNLAELFNGFPRVDPDSQVVLESEPPEPAPDEPRRFSRAMVVPGAARRLDKEGLLTNIMSLDMTFSSFQMNLTDALRLGLKWADGGPLVDPSRCRWCACVPADDAPGRVSE